MTPLAAASPASPSPAASPRPDKAAPGTGQDTAFAQALERRQDTRAEASRTGARHSDADGRRTDPAALETGTQSAADDVADQDVLEPAKATAAATVVDVQQPAPVWPPAGLAALLGFADADAAAAVPPMVDTGSDARPLALAGAMPMSATATPTPNSMAPIALPDATIPESDAALPMPALLAIETAAPAEGGEPAPIAFALPPTTALREPAPMLAAPLPAPEVGAEDFEARFGAQIEWMAEQKIGHARIRVTPNDLGPVEVRLHMDGDRIRAEFVAPQAETRQALEQGLPRLRDLLGEHGFQLAHAGVGSGDAGGRDGDPSQTPSSGTAAADAQDGGVQGQDLAPRRTSRGLLDAYA